MPAEDGHLNLYRIFLFLIWLTKGVAVRWHFILLILMRWPFSTSMVPVASSMFPFNITFRFWHQRFHRQFQFTGTLFNFQQFHFHDVAYAENIFRFFDPFPIEFRYM